MLSMVAASLPGAGLHSRDGPVTENRNRRSGLLIFAIVGALGLLFTGGVVRRSYWALALPVAGGVFSVLYVAFWIGRALIMTPPPGTELPE